MQVAPNCSKANHPLAFHSEPSLWIWTDGCRSHGDGGGEVDHCPPAARVCGEHRPTNQVMCAASRHYDNSAQDHPLLLMEI